MNARLALMATAVLLLSACSEPSQELHSGNVGKPYYDGTGSNFTAAGWKPGDKSSWQQEMKTRTQRGQNEYTRVY
ncbi:lipoprotein [Achromobacter sp. RTa]|uniref:hypothetical protein n=1 Tax=Achromobacter sp. RTa TaxID=1532557 RepID=UPI00050DEE19|nr:hypothetical protein [Achromobacter sp. RTa]KGD90114.1 lipoprotein [Achromobacter sp. RTa]